MATNHGTRKEQLAEGGCAISGQCCLAGRGPHAFARRLSKATASILPAALLMLMPKCPLCLAAWLTVATGVSFSATGAAWLPQPIALLRPQARILDRTRPN